MNNLPLNILTLPVWWYTTGLSLRWDWFKKSFFFSLRKTALIAFARHWREPLFGDYTKSGIVVSFFLRMVLIIFKSIYFSLRVLVSAIGLLLYVVTLPAIILLTIYQLLWFI